MKLNSKLITFFKQHKLYDSEMFDYFEKHSTMIDSNYEDERITTGCAYLIDKKTGILQGLHLNLPYINPNNEHDEMILDSIHELTHAIFTYPKIGKKFKRDITIETLPLLYEKLYIAENLSPKLKEYGKHLDEMVTDEYPEYAFALKAREKLYPKYHKNPEEIAKLVNKMGQLYKFEQFKNKFHHK